MRPLLAAIVLLTLLSVPAWGTELKIATAGSGAATFLFRLAQYTGFYKRESLDVELISVAGGTRGIQLLLSGNVDAITTGLTAVVQANSRGANLRMLAVAQNRLPFVFVSQPYIKTGAALRGGYVPISTFGSEPDMITTMALRELGLSRKDVVIVQMGQNSLRLASLLAGHSAAALLSEPNTSIALHQGFTPLVDFSSTSWVTTGFVTTAALLRDKADILTRALRALVDAGRYADADVKRTKELLASDTKVSDPKMIDALYAEFINSPRMAAVARDSAATVLREMQAAGLNTGDKNFEQYIDDRLIREVRSTMSLNGDYGRSKPTAQ